MITFVLPVCNREALAQIDQRIQDKINPPVDPNERWKPVLGYEGLYEVSSVGRVRSFPRFPERGARRKAWPGKMMRLSNQYGYISVAITKEGKQKRPSVHRLVLEAFVGPCPEGMEACHNDGIADNNRLSNLRWDTHDENMKDDQFHREHGKGKVRPR